MNYLIRHAAKEGRLAENQAVDLSPSEKGQLVWVADRSGWVKGVSLRGDGQWPAPVTRVDVGGVIRNAFDPGVGLFCCGLTSGASFKGVWISAGQEVRVSLASGKENPPKGCVILDVLKSP